MFIIYKLFDKVTHIYLFYIIIQMSDLSGNLTTVDFVFDLNEIDQTHGLYKVQIKQNYLNFMNFKLFTCSIHN